MNLALEECPPPALTRLIEPLVAELRDLRLLGLRIADFREFRRKILRSLEAGFHQGMDIDSLIHGHAALVDALLTTLWQLHDLPEQPELVLVAVGGYGRGELHPGSDIDILILIGSALDAAHRQRTEEAISHFVTCLWDIGLEVGQSVRSIEECVAAARQDITIATNLFEGRWVAGSTRHFSQLQQALKPSCLWDAQAFFTAKLAEQQQRLRRFGETAYRLEPNVKEGPGGLRDIHMIGWVSQRLFGTDQWQELVRHGFLREGEYHDLLEGQRFLWRVRFALHMLAGRREDRLLFNLQRSLAQTFGFTDLRFNLGVEQFMQRYFRSIRELQCLSELLLQHFSEVLMEPPGGIREVRRIHPRFQLRGGFLEPVHQQVFMIYPPALLEVSRLLQTHPEIQGIRASTIRLMRAHRHLVDAPFRRNALCRQLFMDILRAPQGVTTELRRMHRYGLLGAYLPAFGRIIGRMQYDLFHAYTVDEHTLHVVRNVRRYAHPEPIRDLSLAFSLYTGIERPERLLLAALFHDIAKGRGGDHSELGSLDALHFCQHHGLSDEDAILVSWLVRSHLLMSLTAQRRDISDPDVVLEFAREVKTQERLVLLYLLTIADIRGTNPELWNSWKDALLKTLYQATTAVLQRGLESPPDMDDQIGQNCSQAMAVLQEQGLDAESVEKVWEEFEMEYFLRHSADEIAWHTAALVHTRPEDLPLVLVRNETQRGSTEIFVYTHDHPHLFARITAAITQLGLNIVDARIITTHGGFTLDTFLVLDANGRAVEPGYQVDEIHATLQEKLCRPDTRPAAPPRALPRRLKYFEVATQIEFTPGRSSRSTHLRVRALDRPGLLATIGNALAEQGLHVRTARITTAGEQAEDQFLLFNSAGQALRETEQQTLRQRLLELI
jgi:[protein-PII] uridylyltransferase